MSRSLVREVSAVIIFVIGSCWLGRYWTAADTGASNPAPNVIGIGVNQDTLALQNNPGLGATPKPYVAPTPGDFMTPPTRGTDSGSPFPSLVGYGWAADGTPCGFGGYSVVVNGPRGFLLAVPGCPERTPRTAADAASEAWYKEVVLPDPIMSTNPSKAITGLDTYLSIAGPQTVVWEGTALGRSVRIEATSTYDIDWGDPRPDASQPNGKARTVKTTSQGGTYPTGDLRHQYIDRGSVNIVVTQRWTAHWSVGAESGIFPDRLFTTSTLVVPVQEIQAVITR